MILSGVQKLTLLDFPGKVACTIFTGGCNFRCPFCHNASLVLEPTANTLQEDEVLSFLKKRVGILDGVVITGGEPLLHKDISSFLEKIKVLGYAVKLDTNGTNPVLLQDLAEKKLIDYVAMDIKNDKVNYDLATGCDTAMDTIEASISFLLKDTVDYEFRTTIVKGIHTEENLIAIAKWINPAKRYYMQQFKDSGNLLAKDGLSAYTDKEMLALADLIRPYLPSVQVRGIS